MRRGVGRAQTLVEVIVAIALLSVIVVMLTGDLTNVRKTDSAADRSIEISGANFLLGVMKADPGFWTGGPDKSVDWNSGPAGTCYSQLGPYTDPGPTASPNWHTIPSPQPDCDMPYSDPGAPQQGQPDPNASAAPVGDEVQYLWNVSYHNGDPNAADLTVWVRRDSGAPIYEYRAIRYSSPGQASPPPTSTPSGHHGGGGGGGGGNPSPTPTGFGV